MEASGLQNPAECACICNVDLFYISVPSLGPLDVMSLRSDNAGEEKRRLGVVSSSACAVLRSLYREEGNRKVSVSCRSLQGLCCRLGLLTVKSQLGGQPASPLSETDPGH